MLQAASAAEKQLAELTEKLASSDVSAKGMSSELEALRCRAEAAEAEADK